MQILVLCGPNLNLLGLVSRHTGARLTLDRLNRALRRRAAELQVEVKIFQQQSEVGASKIVQRQRNKAAGILLVPGIWARTGYLVRQTSGVTAFVGSGTKPVPLKPDEVENVLKTVGEEAAEPKMAFEPDEAILVNDGPFAEMSGKITEVDVHREKLTVQISIFGRDTPVELDFTQVDKL